MLKKKVLPEIADGKMASYALSEREAGSDAASMRTRAKADGDDWILNGSKCWITNGGKSAWYTVMAVSDPDKGANGISAFMVHEDDEGFTVGPKERKLGIKVGESTPDKRIFLKKEEECLAACTGAPMMMVDHEFHEFLTPEKVDKILDDLK